jgi:hypothetical protein
MLSAALICCALVLSACGQAASRHERPQRAQTQVALPPGVVARVASTSITLQELQHWVGVEAILQSQPVIPDPPSYRHCIAYQATLARAQHTGPRPTTSQLRAQCKAQYEGLASQMLEYLINQVWLHEEARKAHVTVPPAEAEQALRQRFPTEAALRSYLMGTKLRRSDELALLEGPLLLGDLQHAVLPVYGRLRRSKVPETGAMAGEVDGEIGKLSSTMTIRWTPLTHCAPHYHTVAVCSRGT